MRPVLAQMGMEVIDSENQHYSVKKGYDCLVKINGGSAKIEFRLGDWGQACNMQFKASLSFSWRRT